MQPRPPASQVSIWLRSIQLGLVSLLLGLGSVAVLDGEAVLRDGFFQGYTWLTGFVVLQVSLGGMLVALVMKYADNVVKGFATSLSIILSSALSWFIPAFDFAPSPAFVAGSTSPLVVGSTAPLAFCFGFDLPFVGDPTFADLAPPFPLPPAFRVRVHE